MTEELKPCPMCGGEAHLTNGHCAGPQWPGDFHRVYCGTCQLRQLFYATPSEAVTAWNRRALLSASIADTAGAKADPKVHMEYAEGILSELPKLLTTFAIEDLLNRCEDSEDREEVWEAIQAQADIRARQAIFVQLERDRAAAPPASSVADAAGASERDSRIATVTKDLIECLMLWNGQASAGLNVNALAGLRDELNAAIGKGASK